MFQGSILGPLLLSLYYLFGKLILIWPWVSPMQMLGYTFFPPDSSPLCSYLCFQLHALHLELYSSFPLIPPVPTLDLYQCKWNYYSTHSSLSFAPQIQGLSRLTPQRSLVIPPYTILTFNNLLFVEEQVLLVYNVCQTDLHLLHQQSTFWLIVLLLTAKTSKACEGQKEQYIHNNIREY